MLSQISTTNISSLLIDFIGNDYKLDFTNCIKKCSRKIKKIKNIVKPNFNNTIVELEAIQNELFTAYMSFNLVPSIIVNDTFNNKNIGIHSDYTDFKSSIYTDDELFQQIQEVYNKHNEYDLDDEDIQLLEIIYDRFIQNGSLLNDLDKREICRVNNELFNISKEYIKSKNK